VTPPTGPSLPVRHPARRRLAWIAPVVIAGAVAAWLGWNWGTREQAVTVLDPAQVRVVRTPGGMLEVATLQKVEKFGWQVSHVCPLVDCGELLGKTTSEIEVTAHYTYRIPLAQELTLRLAGDHYELVVPPLEPKTPVAFDTGSMRIRTEKGGWLSPSAGPNREAVVRHLGAELARRAQRPEYRQLAQESAAATVAEFARKWMGEQMEPPRHPIRVRFGDAAGSKDRERAAH
jgi:hypothetical protein